REYATGKCEKGKHHFSIHTALGSSIALEGPCGANGRRAIATLGRHMLPQTTDPEIRNWCRMFRRSASGELIDFIRSFAWGFIFHLTTRELRAKH
ncbi:hypothetical protein SMD27_16710, partial [Dongia soli]